MRTVGSNPTVSLPRKVDMKVGTRIKNPDLRVKVQAKAETRFAYLVRWHQFNEVEIKRHEVLKITKKKVTYINEAGIEFTLDRVGYSAQWFLTRNKAKAFARSKLRERVQFYEEVLINLHSQIKKLKPKK